MAGWLFSLSLFLYAGGALAALEIVESVPIETTLGGSGVVKTADEWLAMISASKKSIDLEEFYVSSQAGESLAPILDALRAAGKRGVKIRLLVDVTFYKNYPVDPQSIAEVPNAEVRTVDFASTGGVQHAKYFIVDGATGYVGSANFDWLALTHIHEVGAEFTDAGLATKLVSIFDTDWSRGVAVSGKAVVKSEALVDSLNVKSERPAERSDTADTSVVASPASLNPSGVKDTLTELLGKIAAARSIVQLQNYQYTTKRYRGGGKWTVLDDALRAAAARGVRIQLLLDAAALKSGKADIDALRKVKNVEVKIVTIPEWSGGSIPFARLIHSKYILFDGTSAWVGSENFSENYFTGTRNVGFLFSEKGPVDALGSVFSKVWESGYAK